MKQELAMHDMLSERGRISYEPCTPEQQYELLQTVKQYVAGEIPEIEIVNLVQIRELFRQFKAYIQNIQSEQHSTTSGGARRDQSKPQVVEKPQSQPSDSKSAPRTV